MAVHVEPGFLMSMLNALPLSHGVHTLPVLSSSLGPGLKEKEENLITSVGILLILRFLNNAVAPQPRVWNVAASIRWVGGKLSLIRALFIKITKMGKGSFLI